MAHHTIVGLYPTHALAEDVRSRLRDSGISDSDISIGAQTDGTGTDAIGEPADPAAPRQQEGFWDWLFGGALSDDDRERYSGHFRSGRVAVSVRVRSDVELERVAALLEESNPIDVELDESVPAPGAAMAASPPPADSLAGEAGGDRTIPLAKEELEVGKRERERRYRIRTHVIETPVEEQVRLRDERVVIERRPATGATPAEGAAFGERELEIVERHEEPVVGKRVGAVEEVVVRKDADERVESVRDTVRETKVEVEKEAAGSKPSVGRPHRDTGID